MAVANVFNMNGDIIKTDFYTITMLDDNGGVVKFTDFYESYMNGHYLSERIDDENFRKRADEIVNDIIIFFNKYNVQNTTFTKYNLMVYIVNKPNMDAHGYFKVMQLRDEKTKKSLILQPSIFIDSSGDLENEFKNKEFSTIINKRKSTLFHEVIHFLNYLGWSDKDAFETRLKDKEEKALEFNAYYNQIAKIFDDDLKTGKTFTEVCGENAQELMVKFIEKLYNKTPEMLKYFIDDKKYRWKLIKRISQLYYELRQKYNKKLDQELNECIGQTNGT